MTDISAMLCGDPSSAPHRPGCWLAELEQVATGSAEAAHKTGAPVVVGVVSGLREAGVLRDPDGGVELYALLDHLIDLGLLRPLCTACGKRNENLLPEGLCALCDFALITGEAAS